MSGESKKEYAARPGAPPDYEFSPDESKLWIIMSKLGPVNREISSVIQYDDRFSRVLWSRGSTNNGDMTELQKALDWQLDKMSPGLRDDESANSLTRIGTFFMTLGELIDKRAFPQRTTVDDFVASAIQFLYEKEKHHEWLIKWHDIATAEEPKRREPHFMDRLIQVDKTARDDMARHLGIRKVFHGPAAMPWADEIINLEQSVKGRKLTGAEKSAALARVREYIYQDPESGEITFVSDQGEYSISVSPNILKKVNLEDRREYLQKRLKNPELFDNDEITVKMRDELDAIDLYYGAFKFMQVCLLYFYQQQHDEFFQNTNYLLIPKEDAETWTKQDGANAYRTFKRWAYSLYNASLVYKDPKDQGKRHRKARISRFIFHIDDLSDPKFYIIGYNANLYPVSREIARAGMAADKELLKERRYFNLPPWILAEDLSEQAGYYINWVISENGNAQVADIPAGQKVIAFNGEMHCINANIQQGRREKKPKQMMKVWQELLNKGIILKVEPSIKTLQGWTPKRFLESVVRVYARKDNKELNEYLRERRRAHE